MEIPASLLMSSGMHAYICVKGSLYSADSSVFGLSEEEKKAIVKKFSGYEKNVENGVLIKGPAIQIINALGELGYRVVSSTGETEVTWTMQRDI